MTDRPGDPTNWMEVWQRGQEELLRQWSQFGSAAASGAATGGFANGAFANGGFSNGAGAFGKTPWGTDWAAMFAPQFQGPSAEVARKYFGFFEQYVGASRAFAELLGRISVNPDPAARAQEFTAGLKTLQQPLSQLWHSLLSEQSGGASGLPALGLTREHQEANDRIRKLMADLQQQQFTLSGMWNDIIAEALRDFGDKAGAKIRAGEHFASIKAVYDLWVECGEIAYAKSAHSPEYGKAQADLGNTMAHLRIEQRKQVEAIAKHLDLPTRDELNTVHRRLKDLKSEVRALRAQLRASGANATNKGNNKGAGAKKTPAAKGQP